MTRRFGAAIVLAVAAAACGGGDPGPATLDPRNEACAFCRMSVSEARFAAQIVAPGEEPRFFDDIGCLRDYLRGGARPGPGAVAYVADHRTGAWVRADRAVYTRVETLETPMGSHLVAHADETSRAQDPAARGGQAVAVAELFGPDGPPAGSARR
jgi:copper chaperone NosL